MRKLLFELLHQPGFANPRLPAQQHHLPGTRLGLLPVRSQQPQLVLAANEGREAGPHGDLKAALGLTLSARRDTTDNGVEMPFSVLRPKSWHSNKPCTNR